MIVLVIGMHRSGTSAVAGILHLNGIAMGSEKSIRPKPLPQNPKGFYENYDFRKINDSILKRAGYRVKSFSTEIPAVHASARIVAKMGKLVEKQMSEYEDWGWKDPRTCLTLDNWLSIIREMDELEKTSVVFVTRRAAAVAQSLKERNGLDLDEGLTLWRLYNERALEVTERFEVATFFLSYEALLTDPQSVCAQLFGFLGSDFDRDIVDDFIDPHLNRSASRQEMKVRDDVAELTEKLKALSTI